MEGEKKTKESNGFTTWLFAVVKTHLNLITTHLSGYEDAHTISESKVL